MTLWSRNLETPRDKLKPNLISPITVPIATKIGRMVNLSWKAPNNKATQRPDHVVFQSHVINENHYISTTRVPMATKLSRMVTYFERVLTIKPFYALITWSCKVTWQAKTIISLLQECLQQPNLAEWWLPLMGSYLDCNMALWSRGLVRYEVHLQEEVKHASA